MSLKICFLPTVTEYHWEWGAVIEATMLLGKYCVQHVCVFSPREAWRLMGEKETECIVTPCREPKGGWTRSQNLGGVRGNYPHPQACRCFQHPIRRGSPVLIDKHSKIQQWNKKGSKAIAVCFNKFMCFIAWVIIRYNSCSCSSRRQFIFWKSKIKRAKKSCRLWEWSRYAEWQCAFA